MKYLATIFVSLVMVMNCVGQSLFFDKLENSSWTADSSFTDSVIIQANEIRLTKLRAPKDSITIDRTIWTFKDSLTVTYYNASLKNERLIGTFAYKRDKENELLIIQFLEDEPIEYSVGIISTGSSALLARKKRRN